jgi:hypothetical protein
MRSLGALLLLVAMLAAPVMTVMAQEAAPTLVATTGHPAATETPSRTPVDPASPSPSAAATDAAAGGAVVRGVFFFSPTCPHCEIVITEHLPGLFERFGGEPVISIDESLPPGEVSFYLMSNGRLQLLMVDVSVDPGSRMLVADSERLGVDAGVPRLDIADQHLVGSVDIPAQLPGIVEGGLAADGIDWPPVPDVVAALAPFPEAGVASRAVDSPVSETVLPAASLSVWAKVTRDPLGNGLAILVLLALLGSIVAVPVLLRRGSMP